MLFFRREKFTDIEIIEGLQDHAHLEDAILKYLYSTYYPKIRKHIRSKGGSDVEAKDIFQDVIIAFYQNIKKRKFEHKAQINTYLFTLARNMWINRKKRQDKLVVLDVLDLEDQTTDNQPIDYLLETERNEFALELLKTLGENCQKILMLSIFQKLSMKKISEMLGYQNEQVARNKKSKCLKYLKKAIGKSVNLSNILNELK